MGCGPPPQPPIGPLQAVPPVVPTVFYHHQRPGLFVCHAYLLKRDDSP
jgi:hypothetical protein